MSTSKSYRPAHGGYSGSVKLIRKYQFPEFQKIGRMGRSKSPAKFIEWKSRQIHEYHGEG